MASFAKAQLLKYGWTEGKGLGKSENGIIDPIKPKLKFDTAGIGHETKEYKWWESVYNRASSNININETCNSSGISVTTKEPDSIEISTKRVNIQKLGKTHNLEYGSFLKTCTLDNGEILPAKNLSKCSIDDIVNETASIALTDDELFRACGGRTGHKGARHGLTLNGKLARIAKQEAELLGKMRDNTKNPDEWTEVRKKKEKTKRKRRECVTEEIDVDKEISINTDRNANSVVKTPEIIVESSSSPEIRKKSKASRRKEKRNFQDLTRRLDEFSLIDKPVRSSTKKLKRKKFNESEKRFIEDIARKVENKEIKDNEKSCEITLDNAAVTFETARAPEYRRKKLTDAERSNLRIDMKKKRARAKMTKRKLDSLTDCLMAVNICEDSVDSGRGEDLVENKRRSRIMKSSKKNWSDRKCKKLVSLLRLEVKKKQIKDSTSSFRV